MIEGLQALGKDDPEAAEIVLDTLRAEGVAIHEQAMVAQIRNNNGAGRGRDRKW